MEGKETLSMQNIEKCFQNLMNLQINSIEAKLEATKKDIIATVSASTSKLVKEEIGSLQLKCEEKINSIESVTNKNTKDIGKLIKAGKRKNLIIYGLHSSSNNWSDRLEIILSLLRDKMEVNCSRSDIDFTSNLSKKNLVNGPILVGFTTWNKKMEVLRNRVKLKKSKIFLEEDYTEEVIHERIKLKKIMAELKSQGLKRVYLRHTTLYVDGNEWREDVHIEAGSKGIVPNESVGFISDRTSAGRNITREVRSKKRERIEDSTGMKQKEKAPKVWSQQPLDDFLKNNSTERSRSNSVGANTEDIKHLKIFSKEKSSRTNSNLSRKEEDGDETGTVLVDNVSCIVLEPETTQETSHS